MSKYMCVVLALAAFSLCPSTATAQQTAPKIVEIVVRADKDVRSDLSPLQSGLYTGDLATPEKLERARQVMMGHANLHRYPDEDALDVVNVDTEPVEGGVRVVFRIEHNPIISEIRITGAGPIFSRDILRVMQTKAGQRVRRMALRGDVWRIQDYYKERGYIASVTERVGMRGGVLSVPIVVGKISRIKLKTNAPLQEAIVREVMMVDDGDYYNTLMMRRSYQRLWNYIAIKELVGDLQLSLTTPSAGEVELTVIIDARPNEGLKAVPAGLTLDAREIKEVVFKGNKQLNRDSIQTIAGIKVGDAATVELLEQARKNLLLSGYFGMNTPEDPEASVKITAVSVEGGVRVVITVDENSAIKDVRITGSGPITPEELRKLLWSKAGQIVNINRLRTDVDVIQDYYREKGYVASVTEKIGIQDGALLLPMEVARFGKFHFKGNGPVSKAELLKAMKVKEGDYYNINTMRGVFDRIEALYREKGIKVEVVRNVEFGPDVYRGIGYIEIHIQDNEKPKPKPSKPQPGKEKKKPARKRGA